MRAGGQLRRIARPWCGATRPHHDEAADGFTLIELAVAMLLGSIVLTLVLVTISGVLDQGLNGSTLGQANDKANLALDAIQRDVVSADVIFPATVLTAKAGKNATGATITAGFGVRMLTYATKADTCVQWRVLKTGQLERRSWPTGNITAHKKYTWVPIVTGVKNTSSQKVFTLNTTTTYGGRLLSISLYLKSSSSSTGTTKTVNVEASYASRDAEFFSSTDTQFCPTVPST